MDVTRNQLKHVSAATIHLKNKESKIGAKVRNLSYKLLRAKSKLEAVSAAKEKTKSIVSNLTQTLDKLKSKTKAAKKEKDLIINGEVAETKEEIKKALLEIKVSEERFQVREGKDNTKGFLQQTREKVKGATQGATETVKKTLGLGQHDEDNRKNY
ncbi:late embryogenesis abundant protein 2-like [Glycine soja]|uniref:late embryogenesis abundant protein 2-like n=1 Tax=Glycine soja TaxID=3848 RepID=UPI0003DE8C87|nr:late embryogenesis abundant protein 2-like [Glycine soja]|eukprot:XP_006604974.1 late embryogenesis abundant protein 2-like [Glycine max]